MEQPTLFDNPPVELPVLPYAGTSGWAGSDTSRERAETADSTGETSRRQHATLTALNDAGADGLTWNELGALLGVHHGSASGVLSVLHRHGLISRLEDRRNKCAVYVATQHVYGRPLNNYKPTRANRLLAEILTAIADDLDAGRVTTARARIGATLNSLDNQ